MLSFKSFLVEQMKIDDLKLSISNMGYEIKKVSGKNIDVIVPGSSQDRISFLKDIAQKLNGRYNPRGGSSSVGRAEISGFYINSKPKGGGSGAGSDVTALTESAQCAYAAALWYGKDFSSKSIKAAAKYFDINVKTEDVINKLSDQWVDSCIITAEKLKKEFGKKRYTFHRGSTWVESLETHWKNLNKIEKQFTNLNKWSPADIYMISDAGKRIKLTEANTIIELNAMMLKAIKSRDIIGVSLKQVKGTAKLDYKNVSKDRYTYEFEKLTTGKREFFASGDAYIYFNGGEIQFRTFGSTWQGEIKGKTANMGKISGGPINTLMAKNGITLKPQSAIVEKTLPLVKEFYKWYKHFEKGNAISEKEFITLVDSKDQNWWVSKYLSVQLMYKIDILKQEEKNTIVTSMIGYAASESDLSAPYVKVS